MYENVLSLPNILSLYTGCSVDFGKVVDVSLASAVNYINGAIAVAGSVPHTGVMVFNGISEYVDLSPLPAFSGSATIAAWVYWYAFNSWSRILDCGNGAGVNNILLANVGTSNVLAFHVYGSTTVQLDSSPVLVTGQWTHVAGVVDVVNNIMVTYVNGVNVGSMTPPVGGVTNVTRNNCWIGRSNWPADAYFSGVMDQVVLSGTAFSQTQIQDLVGVVDECASNPCQSSGVCIDGVNSYSCVYCNTNACANGGTCIFQSGGFLCQCPSGFSGPFCIV